MWELGIRANKISSLKYTDISVEIITRRYLRSFNNHFNMTDSNVKRDEKIFKISLRFVRQERKYYFTMKKQRK